MQWRGRRGSRNIIDRRGTSGRGARRAGVGGLGIVGTLAVLAVGWFLGIDLSPLVGGGGAPVQQGAPITQSDRDYGQFVSVVLADTEDIWGEILPSGAQTSYLEPQLVLFTGVVSSACGSASSAMGPFYCPGDRRIYLDTDFFDILSQRMGAKGDFAAAYVIAHEVGHHVQNLIGVLPEVNRTRSQLGEAASNRLSVATELQADCFAGIWAHHLGDRFGVIDEGDLTEAMTAAKAVGDDVIQRSAGRTPMPDSFTHGSAADRQEWLMRGYHSGQLSQCNTFSAMGVSELT